MTEFKIFEHMSKSKTKKKALSRRGFLKAGAVAAVSVAAASVLSAQEAFAKAKPKSKRRLAMVIDLQRCTGCGGCMISCKNENNVQKGATWSYKKSKTVGKFPNVRYDYMPTLCNHCAKAPCVRVCPTGARYKGEGDITAQTPEKCIGCKRCMEACPYEGVIYFNSEEPHSFWRDDKALIEGATESAKEVTKKAKSNTIPYYNPDREVNLKGSGLRREGIVEKCTFCDHRVKRNKLPYCVLRCPADARIFGDLNDPNSKVNEILGKYEPMRLKEHLGTEPKVFYVRNFNPANYKKSVGSL